MTVKVALLKSGQQIICDIKEMVSGEKVIGYFFEFPYVIHLRSPELITNKDAPVQLEISLFNWLPLSKDHQIPVPSDWVVTIFEPTNKVMEMYDNLTKRIRLSKEKSENNGEVNDKTDSTVEQSDSDKQD
jgi:hypothetical protein